MVRGLDGGCYGKAMEGEAALGAAEAEAKALTSVVRLRILRLCLDEPRTNKELADRLGLHPATCLHHVRQLLEHGFLRAEPERRGKRGAREVPYSATKKSWTARMLPGSERILVQAFLDEFALADPSRAVISRLGVRLSPEARQAMLVEFSELLQKYSELETDPSGEPWSLFFVAHPDSQRAPEV